MRRILASRRAIVLAALCCIAAMLVSVNVIAARFATARLDLTADHLYTLSPGTLRTLQRIDEPITLRFFYSHRLGNALPAYGVYAAQVHQLLDQYVAAAHGKLRLEVYDPQPFSKLEDRAVAFGLQAVPLDAQGDQVYFGLAGTNSTDDRQVIPFFQPQRAPFLEYDLTRLIHNLAVPKKPTVGLLTSLPLAGNPAAMMTGQPSAPMAILPQLRRLCKIVPLTTNLAAIPAKIGVLLLVQPEKLPQQTLYAIDQYVLKGGKALILMGPSAALAAAAPGEPSPSPAAAIVSLAPLFKAWGFRMPAGKVAGDLRNAELVALPGAGGGQMPVRYVAWLGLGPRNLNRRDIITADLHRLTIPSSGLIEPLKGRTTKVEPLVTTSRQSETIPAAKLAGLPDVAGLLAGFKPDNKRLILAARITGPAQSAFPGGPPQPQGKTPTPSKAAQPKAPPAQVLKRSLHPIDVIVIADSDLLASRFWAHRQDFFGRRVLVPFADNGAFIANAVEVLAGGRDLIGLRTRGTATRPFTVVDRLQRAAQARYSAEAHALRQKLHATEAKLASLTGGRGGPASATLSPREAKTIAQFRAALIETRRQLRTVQAGLRGSIEHLKFMLEFFDIAAVPLIVALVAVVLGFLRMRRRGRRRMAAEA